MVLWNSDDMVTVQQGNLFNWRGVVVEYIRAAVTRGSLYKIRCTELLSDSVRNPSIGETLPVWTEFVVDMIPARQLLPVTRAYAARAICPNCRLNNCDNCALSSAKVYILK